MSDEKDLDLSFLYEIADGSNEFIVESISMFLQQTPDLIKAVEDAIAAKDWPVAATAAHKLKPNLGFFGMLNCQAMLQDVEVICKSGAPDFAEVNSKFTKVKQELAVNLTALEKVKLEKAAEL